MVRISALAIATAASIGAASAKQHDYSNEVTGASIATLTVKSNDAVVQVRCGPSIDRISLIATEGDVDKWADKIIMNGVDVLTILPRPGVDHAHTHFVLETPVCPHNYYAVGNALTMVSGTKPTIQVYPEPGATVTNWNLHVEQGARLCVSKQNMTGATFGEIESKGLGAGAIELVHEDRHTGSGDPGFVSIEKISLSSTRSTLALDGINATVSESKKCEHKHSDIRTTSGDLEGCKSVKKLDDKETSRILVCQQPARL